MAIPRVRCSMPPESAHGNADGSCLPTTGCVQTPVQTCVGPFRQTRPKRRPARHRPTELSSQEGQPDAGVAERRTPAFSLDRAPADASASSAVSLQSLNLREASRQAGEEIALSADFHTTSPEQDMDCHSSAPYQIYRSSVDDSAHGEECFYSPRTATSEEPVDCEPRGRSSLGSHSFSILRRGSHAFSILRGPAPQSAASGCRSGKEQGVVAVHGGFASPKVPAPVGFGGSPGRSYSVSRMPPDDASFITDSPTSRDRTEEGCAFQHVLAAVSLPGSRRTPAGLRKRSFTCALDVGASRTRFCSPQSGPTPEHACVCGIASVRLVQWLGRKQRCSPVQNLDCPIVFGLVALQRPEAAAAGAVLEDGGQPVSDEAHSNRKLPAIDTGVCPAQAAAAAFVVLKGKFASLVINSIVTSDDYLSMEGLRCRPFFRPGHKEDLYSWARAALVRMRQGAGDSPSPGQSSSFLRDVCLTHYFTLSDVYDDGKLTISPRPTNEHHSAGLLPAPFSLSAPELVTCSVLPQSLPLPDWLVSRNRGASRSLFTSRVLRKSAQLLQASVSAPATPEHQLRREPETRSGSVDDGSKEEKLVPRSTETSCSNGHRGPSQQRAKNSLRRNTDPRGQAGLGLSTDAAPNSPRGRREKEKTSSPRADEGMSLSVEGRGGNAICTAPHEVGSRGLHAVELQRKAGQGDGGSEYQGTRNPYVYAELTAVQANRGTNFYAIVWEVTKALMPPPGGRGVAAFLMNVAVFDESVRFDVGIHTAPGGHAEEYSLALKAKGCPADIPCLSCGDVVRVHRANVSFKFEAERNFVNLSSVLGVTAARVWPVDAVSADADHPSAEGGFPVGATQLHTHFSEEDALRIRALRYHAQQLLSGRRLFTTQYYKPLSLLRRFSMNEEPAYGDLIVRVVKSSMGPCCRILDLDDPEPLVSDYGWVRGDATVAGSHPFDSELSAYLLLVEDASLPGGHIAVVNLSEATCEQLFAAENAIREGQWLRLRNFRWSRFRLEDAVLGRVYECIQPSRSDLARITRLPQLCLDTLVAQQELDGALQGLLEEAGLDEATTESRRGCAGMATMHCETSPVQGEAVVGGAALNGLTDPAEAYEEWAVPAGALGASPHDGVPVSQDRPVACCEVHVPQELLDVHFNAIVYSRLGPLLSLTGASPVLGSTPLRLKGMHILGLGPPSAMVSEPRTWVVVQCLLCRHSRRLTPSGNRVHTGATGSSVTGLRNDGTAEENLEVLWCPVCRHKDASMLVAVYDFYFLLADEEGMTLPVRLKDAVGRRFRCASEGGISPFFAATDAGAQRLLCRLLKAVLTVTEEHGSDADGTEAKRVGTTCKDEQDSYSSPAQKPRKQRGHAAGKWTPATAGGGAAREVPEASSGSREAERPPADGPQKSGQTAKSASRVGAGYTCVRGGGEEQREDEQSSEEEGEVRTQGLVGRRYMRQLKEASRRRTLASVTATQGAPEQRSEVDAFLGVGNEDCLPEQGARKRKGGFRGRRNLGPGRHELLILRRAVTTVATSPHEWVVLGCEFRRRDAPQELSHSASGRQ